MSLIRRLTFRERFHILRLFVWTIQIPLAIVTPLKESVSYLVFLSLAALVESALTDVDQARQDRLRGESK